MHYLSDACKEKANESLRQAIKELRKRAGFDLIHSGSISGNSVTSVQKLTEYFYIYICNICLCFYTRYPPYMHR